MSIILAIPAFSGMPNDEEEMISEYLTEAENVRYGKTALK